MTSSHKCEVLSEVRPFAAAPVMYHYSKILKYNLFMSRNSIAFPWVYVHTLWNRMRLTCFSFNQNDV